jgi:hypothetical protein
MDQAAWGGYVRHNALYRRVWDREGRLVEERFLFANDAIMMYSPLLAEAEGCHPSKKVVHCETSGAAPPETE